MYARTRARTHGRIQTYPCHPCQMKTSAGKPCWAWVSVARVNRRQACHHPCHPCRDPCHRGQAIVLRAPAATSKPSLAGAHIPGTSPQAEAGLRFWHCIGEVAARTGRIRLRPRQDGSVTSCRRGMPFSWWADHLRGDWAEGRSSGACAQIGFGSRLGSILLMRHPRWSVSPGRTDWQNEDPRCWWESAHAEPRLSR